MNTTAQTYHPGTPPKSLIKTKRMYRWLEQMASKRDSYFPGSRGYTSITKTMATLMRTIRHTEIFNYRIKTKWEMLRDPKWRARVLKELGGEKALARWEARKAKVDAAKGNLQEQIDTPSPKETLKDNDAPNIPDPSGAPRFKTDSQGQFRLAVVSAARPSFGRHAPRKASTCCRGPRSMSLPDLETIKFPIIALEPFELRGPVVPSAQQMTLQTKPHALRGPYFGSVQDNQMKEFKAPKSQIKSQLTTTRRLALGTASDFVIDTATPRAGSTLQMKWSGFGPAPKGRGPD